MYAPWRVLSTIHALTHLTCRFIHGKLGHRGLSGFPRAMQLVIQLRFKCMQSLSASRGLTTRCPNTLCCLQLIVLSFVPFQYETTSLFPLHLPAASYQFITPCCWLLHILLHFRISHLLALSYDMHPVYERPDQWLVLCISKIFALGIPKPQPQGNKLATKNTLGVRSIASERY